MEDMVMVTMVLDMAVPTWDKICNLIQGRGPWTWTTHLIHTVYITSKIKQLEQCLVSSASGNIIIIVKYSELGRNTRFIVNSCTTIKNLRNNSSSLFLAVVTAPIEAHCVLLVIIYLNPSLYTAHRKVYRS